MKRKQVTTATLGQNYEKQLLANVKHFLSDRDAVVLKLRFGLDGEKAHTYKAIGKRLGITGERARGLLWNALRKMWEPGRRRAYNLGPFLVAAGFARERALTKDGASAGPLWEMKHMVRPYPTQKDLSQAEAKDQAILCIHRRPDAVKSPRHAQMWAHGFFTGLGMERSERIELYLLPKEIELERATEDILRWHTFREGPEPLRKWRVFVS